MQPNLILAATSGMTILHRLVLSKVIVEFKIGISLGEFLAEAGTVKPGPNSSIWKDKPFLLLW